jgi:hypothetical protein
MIEITLHFSGDMYSLEVMLIQQLKGKIPEATSKFMQDMLEHTWH